ncbi:MAG: hypothetical protein GY803_28160, partial [Chloroflexi bacterium]|nr:hypothetical protein [Chloroflexota bacterium]
ERRWAYLDLGGIAPKVNNRTVKIAMGDIYVPVQAERELDARRVWKQLRSQMAHRGLDAFPARQLERGLASAGDDVDMAELMRQLRDEDDGAAWELFQKRWQPERPAQETVTVGAIFAAPRAVLLGHPGTGKSTSLKYLAYAIAAGLDDWVDEATLGRLPILVKMVDYAKAQKAEATLCLRDYVRDAHDKDRAPLFREALAAGNCLVMLDGLDEVIDPAQRRGIIDQVEALTADYPNNHYLLASRIVGFDPGWLTGDFVHYK